MTGIIIGFLVANYLPTNNQQVQPEQATKSEEISKLDLELQFEYSKTFVSEAEAISILSTIRTFEIYQAKRDGKEVLNMFTAPSSDKEQQGYNFLTGKDLTQPTSLRMYGTAGLDFKLNWYYVIDITKKADVYVVLVKELRTARDNSTPDYFASIDDLIFELVKISPSEYKIDKYYYRKDRLETVSNLTKKYNGFY
ncbi:MAG: hypothetical protein G01um10145_443 [Microgenomates group bacterium Gr01-1014_5]|nr:MAG: hypothetical protein G01um10145_443 [Microgenomates group bacterium Gr01-1014_5]